MEESLLKAVQALHERAQDEGILGTDVDNIDQILSDQRPTKRKPPKLPDEVKKELVEDFLTPPTSFNQKWLNKLQQYVVWNGRSRRLLKLYHLS